MPFCVKYRVYKTTSSNTRRFAVRRVVVVLLAFVSSIIVGCSGDDGSAVDVTPNAGPGGRQQPLALSPSQELAVGRRAYSEVMNDVRGRSLPVESADVQRVHRVVDRIAQAAAIEPLQ